MVEGGMKCVKYLLFAFNLIFFLAGLGLIIAGALVQTKFNEYFDFFGGSLSAAAILLIVVGGIIFLIGFFGCCGAYKENYCMIMMFAVLLGLIFILEIAAAITAYVLKDKAHSFVTEKLTLATDNYGISEGVTRTWDKAQQEFKCCGVDNYEDWYGQGTMGDNEVPASCCVNVDNNNCTMRQTTTNTYQDGCVRAFVDWVKENIYIIAGVGIGLAFVQVLGVILALCLGRAIKKDYEVV